MCTMQHPTKNDERRVDTHVVTRQVRTSPLSPSHTPTTEPPAPTYFDIDILIRLYQFRTVVLVRLWFVLHSPSLSLCLCACASVSVPGSAVLLRRGPRRPRGPVSGLHFPASEGALRCVNFAYSTVQVPSTGKASVRARAPLHISDRSYARLVATLVVAPHRPHHVPPHPT